MIISIIVLILTGVIALCLGLAKADAEAAMKKLVDAGAKAELK
jgi:ribosomal protein L7/L12